MNTPLFIETIKVHDGCFIHVSEHLRRMEQTVREVFGIRNAFHLPEDLIPIAYRQGVVKCRIEYDTQIQKIEFTPYVLRPIHSLKIVEGNQIDYHLKYADRQALHYLLALKGDCDDILITRHGKITDTSYSNVAFFDGSGYVTPSTFLLNGTQRRLLISQGILTPKNISINDLSYFRSLHIINAMIGLEDHIAIEISKIVL